MNSIAIADVFLFLTILLMAISAQLEAPVFFLLSWIAVLLAGAMRHDELEKAGRLQ